MEFVGSHPLLRGQLLLKASVSAVSFVAPATLGSTSLLLPSGVTWLYSTPALWGTDLWRQSGAVSAASVSLVLCGSRVPGGDA